MSKNKYKTRKIINFQNYNEAILGNHSVELWSITNKKRHSKIPPQGEKVLYQRKNRVLCQKREGKNEKSHKYTLYNTDNDKLAILLINHA